MEIIMIRSKIVLPILICSILLSCKKEPGPGGLASIKGRVFAYDLTNQGDSITSGYLGDIRVYIAAMDDSVSFDDVRTSYNGAYEFNFLRKGTYKVWVFAESDTAVFTPGRQQYFMQQAEVKDKKQEVILNDFIVNI
jgi:hypothetical protein